MKIAHGFFFNEFIKYLIKTLQFIMNCKHHQIIKYRPQFLLVNSNIDQYIFLKSDSVAISHVM